MTIRTRLAGAAIALALSTTGNAQGPGGPVPFHLPVPGPGDHVFLSGRTGATADFISMEMAFETSPVKGMPFSAEAINEFSQSLADGNRISQKSSSMIYRDSEGRTRRETGLPSSVGAAGEAASRVIIMDPVGQTGYLLDTKNKTARKLPAFVSGSGPGVFAFSNTIEENGKRTSISIQGRHAEGVAITGHGDEGTKQDLGKRNIEGVSAEGTRTTTTIPAGTIGNERAIQIVHERWYSPELKQVILSKHTDPRMGETTYRLTGIRRSEPASNLFEVPSDYTVSAIEGPDMKLLQRKIKKL